MTFTLDPFDLLSGSLLHITSGTYLQSGFGFLRTENDCWPPPTLILIRRRRWREKLINGTSGTFFVDVLKKEKKFTKFLPTSKHITFWDNTQANTHYLAAKWVYVMTLDHM